MVAFPSANGIRISPLVHLCEDCVAEHMVVPGYSFFLIVKRCKVIIFITSCNTLTTHRSIFLKEE